MGEMQNVLPALDEFMGTDRAYMHLMPTATLEPLMDEEQEDDSWTDSVMNRMKGCGHKMKTWYYGDIGEEDYNEDSFDDDMEEYDAYQYEDLDARLVGTSIIFAFMMLCVVVCVGKRCVFAQKKKMKKRIMAPETSEGYVTLQETDAF